MTNEWKEFKAYFSRKWLCKIPNTILERSPQKCGMCRVKLK